MDKNLRPRGDSGYWVVVPAAGSGSRLGGDLPKQYRLLGKEPLLLNTLRRLSSHACVAGLVVVLSADDSYWSNLNWRSPVELLLAEGGETRCRSVYNGLRKLPARVSDSDWVLVHDAARPCLHPDDLDRLLDSIPRLERRNLPGAVLAGPVSDTLKRGDTDGLIVETVDRTHLFNAYTPQVFRRGDLARALLHCETLGIAPTDESSAMEQTGKFALLVPGRADNIKVTLPGDLALAAHILARQEQASGPGSSD